MDGLAQRPEIAALIPPAALDGRIVYFPVRHHSPACAWHVGRLIREIKPAAVLIEGPRDATRLIPFLTDRRTRLPVAVYTTFVERIERGPPIRRAAYYPLCDYSPELAAIRAAAEVGATAKFVDLTFPEMVRAEQGKRDDRLRSLLEERFLSHSRLLKAACRRAGARDPDDLWDHLYEVNYEDVPVEAFVRNVLAYCALARNDHTPEVLAADGCAVREAAIAHAVAAERGRVVVVTGGFHTLALPTTAPALPPAVQVGPDDAQVVLMRYGFEQLDRLNGYASGMPSPEFYQRSWEGRRPAEIIVELARECRGREGGVSPADAIAAFHQARQLARLRGHARLSREDLLDGIRSAFIKGSEDVEGVLILAKARKLLAGDRVGDVPPEAGLPPIVDDFRRCAGELKIDLDRTQGQTLTLDLYRKTKAREISRFFYRLKFLGVPFGEWVAGPDFVGGTNLDRVQETWNYHWSPAAEATLIERSLYGATLDEAAAALLLERMAEAEKQGQGRRADRAAELLLEACRMGLHRHTQMILVGTGALIAEDSVFVSLVRAMEMLLVLHVSREPLEAHHLVGITEMAGSAHDRACYLLPRLVQTPDAEEKEVLDMLNAFAQAANALAEPGRRQLRDDRLADLLATTGGAAAFRGAAAGLRFADGMLSAAELVRHLRGHLFSGADQGKEGPNFLRGLLRTARSVLWQLPEVLGSIHDLLRQWEEERFVGQLPALRLAFADLTPRECDRVAEAVAAHGGVESLSLPQLSEFAEADLVRGVELNRRLIETLRGDGLEAFGA